MFEPRPPQLASASAKLRWWVRRAGRAYVGLAPTDRGLGRVLFDVLPRVDHAASDPILCEPFLGLRMRLDLGSTVDRLVYYTGFYRPWVRHYFDALLAPGQCVVDVGANIGVYTLWASSRVGDSGRVHAFEPAPRPFARLEENVGLNRLTNVTPVPRAVAATEGTLHLNLAPKGDPNLGRASLIGRSHHGEQVTVETVSLDGERSAGRIPAPDVLKIDAQGAESSVLEGARRCLEEHRPHLLVRFSQLGSSGEPDRTRSGQSQLMSAGYAVYEICGGYEYLTDPRRTELRRLHEPRATTDSTVIAVHPDRRSGLPEVLARQGRHR